jgi:hypothetical protein
MFNLKTLEAAINRPEAEGSSRILAREPYCVNKGVTLWAWVGRTDVEYAMSVMAESGWTLVRDEYDDMGDDDCPKPHRFLVYEKGGMVASA